MSETDNIPTVSAIDLSPKQRNSIVEATSFINIWVGAVRSGKTYSSIIAFAKHIMEGPPGDAIICGRTDASLERNIIKPLAHFFGIDFNYYVGKRSINLWGHTVYIVGANDERAQTKIQGPTFMGAYVDEIALIPESFYMMLYSRLSVTGAKLFATCNPESPFHWLKTKVIDNEGVDKKVFHFTLPDNPSLSQTYITHLKHQYSGLWYKRFISGLWVLAEGTIYDFFEDDKHSIDFPPGQPKETVVGVDYGTTNPCAFIMMGYNDELHPNVWTIKEYYYDSKARGRQKTDAEYADDLEKFIIGHNVRMIYVDPSAASFITECKKRHLPVKEAVNDVLDGIRFTSKCLSEGTFKITKNCKRLLEEIATYSWDDKSLKLGIDKPLKQSDHACDATRYCLFTHFYRKKTRDYDIDGLFDQLHGHTRNKHSFFDADQRSTAYGAFNSYNRLR